MSVQFTLDFRLVVQKLRRESAHAAGILNRKFCACMNSPLQFLNKYVIDIVAQKLAPGKLHYITVQNEILPLGAIVVASYPGPPFNFARGKYVILHHFRPVWVCPETPPFTMTSFQSAHGQVAVWCKYSSSETDE